MRKITRVFFLFSGLESLLFEYVYDDLNHWCGIHVSTCIFAYSIFFKNIVHRIVYVTCLKLRSIKQTNKILITKIYVLVDTEYKKPQF